MEKKAFVTKNQIEEIVKTHHTPFHIYDEKGIRENCERVKKAFAWNKGFREYFAVKATPNPYILDIINDYGFGFDCSSEARQPGVNGQSPVKSKTTLMSSCGRLSYATGMMSRGTRVLLERDAMMLLFFLVQVVVPSVWV